MSEPIVSPLVMKKAQYLYDKERITPIKETTTTYYFLIKGMNGYYDVKIMKRDNTIYNCTCKHGSGPRFKKKAERCSHWVACLIWLYQVMKVVPTMEILPEPDFEMRDDE